jgi:PAS domain S-box-containing protein
VKDTLEIIADHIPAVIAAKSPDGRFTYVNGEFERLFRTSREQVLGRSNYDIMDRQVADALIDNDRKVLAGGVPLSFEEQLLVDGKLRTYASIKFPIRDPAGAVTGLGIIAMDITLRKQLEEERELTYQLAEALNAINDLIHSSLDFEEIMRKVADAAAEAVGSETFAVGLFEGNDYVVKYPCAGLAGIEGWRHPLPQLTEAEAVASLRDVAIMSEPRQARQLSLEPVRRLGIKSMMIAPLIIKGEVVGLLNFFYYEQQIPAPGPQVDFARKLATSISLAVENARVHEQVRGKEAELATALAQAEEGRRILDALMENIPMGIGIAEAPDARIRRVSRFGLEMTGRPRDQLEDIPAELHAERWQVFRPDGAAAGSDELPLTRAVRKGELVFEQELVLGRPDGTRLPVLCTAAPIRDREGRIMGGVIGWQDISSRKRVEKEREHLINDLTRSNQDLEQVAYVISHDLQAPLRTIAGFLDLLKRRHENQLAPEARELVAFAMEGAARMRQMVGDLLVLARVATVRSPLERVDSGEPLAVALANLNREIEESRAEVTIEGLPPVTADRSQLAQLFQNLVGNAIKYRKKGEPPRIRIAAEDRGTEWEFRVEDNGIGFDSRDAERIFQIFQRLHTVGEYPGTGIGLAICTKIVERHGGRIRVESEPGKGSTFFFTLSRAE